jgi:hypothetical protein
MNLELKAFRAPRDIMQECPQSDCGASSSPISPGKITSAILTPPLQPNESPAKGTEKKLRIAKRS